MTKKRWRSCGEFMADVLREFKSLPITEQYALLERVAAHSSEPGSRIIETGRKSRARWIEMRSRSGMYICSACGNESAFREYCFCPFCGAEMEGRR